MDARILHGNVTPADFARDIIAYFHRGNFRVMQVGEGDKISLQIATRERPSAGGQTALTILFQAVPDGVSVQFGKQAVLGVAASMGWTALSALRNPFTLLGRIDDLAQDIESLQLAEEAWKVIESTAQNMGVSYELSERLKRYVCEYCDTPNAIGATSCVACGAPLGNIQPITCRYCGYILRKNETFCPNCKKAV